MALIVGSAGGTSKPKKRRQPVVVRPSPDAQDVARNVRRPSVSYVSPDAADVAGRSRQQQAHDRAVVAQTVSAARRAYLHQQAVSRPSLFHELTSSTAGKPSTHPRIAYRGKITLGRQGADPVLAPGLQILSQLGRIPHAITNETLTDVRRGGLKEIFALHPPGSPAAKARQRALVRGFQNKDQPGYQDVLKAAGWRPKGTLGKIAEAGIGFGLDVGLDPQTWAAPGLSALGRGTVKIGAKVPATVKAEQAVRGSLPVRLARHVNPNIRPAGVSPEDWATVRQALRRSRGIAGSGEKRARNVATAIARKLPGASHPKITDALESRSVKGLTKNEASVVHALQGEYDAIHAAEHSKGLVGAKFPEFGYSPRRPLSELEHQGSRRRLSGSQLASSKARTNRQPYAAFRGSEHDIYTENAPLAYYLRARDSAVKQGRHEVITALHSVGRVFHPGAEIKAGEDIYKFAPRKMPVKVEGDELKSLMAGGAPAGRNEYRILHNGLVSAANQSVPQKLGDLEELGRLWDRSVQGRIKTILTVPNPQYHLTNLYGDLFNAYLGSNTASLAKNLGISVRALKYKASREAAAKTLGKQISKTGTTKIGGRAVGLDELIKEAEDHGAIGQGFVGRDLADVLDAQGKEAAEKIGRGRVARKFGKAGQRVAASRVGSKIVHPIDTIRDIGQYREDAVRLTTYLGARKRGLGPDDAAAYVARHHFDYGDLTTFERSVLRRVLPFYTFTARNTPLQVRTLLANPGKYANLEKVREEARKNSNVPAGYESNLRLFEQQGLPIPVPGTGNLLYPKLPATDLSRLTVKDQGNYLMQMLTPLIKSPVELSQNYSFFFRQPIDELLNSPDPQTGKVARTLKPAPAWLIHAIQKIPAGQGDALLRDLHIRQYTDQTSGKKVWGWPAKLDYLAKQTPFSSTALQLGTGLPTTRGQSTGQKVFGYATGLKVAPYSTPQINQQRASSRYNYLQAKAKEMRRNGDAYTAGGARTPAYQKILDQTRAVEKQLPFLNRRRGGTGAYSPAAAAALSALPQGGAQFSPGAQAALDALGGR